MKKAQLIIIIIIIISVSFFYSCVNSPKKQPDIKKQIEFGNEIFLGFKYGSSKEYFMNHLEDMVNRQEVKFNQSDNRYSYQFKCAGIDPRTKAAYSYTEDGWFNPKLDAQFDSEFGLYKLTIHIGNIIEENIHTYFCDLYTNKYGKSENYSEDEYYGKIVLNTHYYNAWTDKKVSVKLDRYYTSVKLEMPERILDGRDRIYYLHLNILYLNDNAEQIIKIRDKAIEDRNNNEVIKKSNDINSTKF